jgi:hypothetical protein
MVPCKGNILLNYIFYLLYPWDATLHSELPAGLFPCLLELSRLRQPVSDISLQRRQLAIRLFPIICTLKS